MVKEVDNKSLEKMINWKRNETKSMKIYNLQDKLEYLEEVAILEYEEWASNKEENKQTRIERKKEKICNMLSNKSFCKLILVNNHKLSCFYKKVKQQWKTI